MAKTSSSQPSKKRSNTKSDRSRLTKSIIAVVIIAVVTLLGLGFYLNRQKVFDFFAANSYAMPADVIDLESHLKLTGDAALIFRASHPRLEDQEQFNVSCDSHDEEISILGCFTDGKIYIYNITEKDLTGIKESTAAHELLHAVWERLSPADKAHLSNQLATVYNDEKYHALLSEDLENYDSSNLYDELHSRVGTEIAELPDSLEKHYAKYFENQDLVVDFYDSYITPFRELSDELDALSTRLDELNELIDQKSAAYYKSAEELSVKIDEFNACADQLGCFINDIAFYNQRNKLLAEQNQLSDVYSSISTLVDEYNQLVKEYNENVLRSERLEQMINSNKQVETIN